MPLYIKRLMVGVLLFSAVTVCAEARNPLSSYLLKLLDESKAEIAVGNLLAEGFIAELQAHASASELLVSKTAAVGAKIEQNVLPGLVADLASRSPRPTLPYEVIIVESQIPRDIAFPGGPIIITRALWNQALTPAEREFLVARNIMHVALRQPMNIIKREGLYAQLLKLVKQRPCDQIALREAVRDYLKAASKMDQIRADREGIMLSESPASVREAGIALLKRLGELLWPFDFETAEDISARIRALEHLALP